MELLIFYFCLAVFVSFLCSILEAVLLSVTPSFISAMKGQRARTGRLLENLKENVDRPLAAILSLNTIAHTVGAAGVGAQAQIVFDNIPLSVISGVLTLLILVFSEIIPKTLGAEYWRRLAAPSAYTIQFLTLALKPLVALSSAFSSLLTRGGSRRTISRAEIRAVADLGHQEGVIDDEDARMLQSIVESHAVRIHEISTPRPVVRYFDLKDTVRDVVDAEHPLEYSRYPVLEAGERIHGYVLRNEILEAAAADRWQTPIASLVRKVVVLPESTPVKTAFVRFLRNRAHMAVVVDEFGGFSGVLTFEDVVETLIGHEIMDEGDRVEDLREHARQSHKESGGGESPFGESPPKESPKGGPEPNER